MNKKFILAWVVVFVVWYLGSFVVHGLLLHADYMQVAGLFRAPEEQQHYLMPMLLAHISMSGAFAWIYARGLERKPWLAQGVRYGIAIVLLAVLPTYLIYYAVQPMPAAVVVKQIVFDAILVVVLGVVVAWMYRDRAASA